MTRTKTRASAIGPVMVLLFGAGCSSPNDAPPPAIPSPSVSPKVVNGTPSPSSQDAVVMILAAQQMCSGTLIAPNLVLTARHCVANVDQATGTVSGDLAPSELSVGIGADQTPDNANVVAQGVKIYDDGSTTLDSHDVALLQLDQDVQGAQAAIVREAATAVGELVTVVGFGEDGSGQLTNGRYQRGGIAVLAVGPKTFTFTSNGGQSQSVDVPAGTICTGESACHGDSGGPIFDAQGQVVGVVSGPGGTVDTCIDAPAFFSDVTSHYAMIAQAAAAAGHPLPPSIGGSPDAGAPDAGGSSGSDAAPPIDAGHDASIPANPSGGASSSSGGSSSGGDSSGNGDFGQTGTTSAGCSSGAKSPDATLGVAFVAFVAFARGARRRRRTRAPAG